jgi:transcriptional regulator with XRE-family HTH domain
MKGVLLVAGSNRIKQLRKELHLTQKQLADKINVSSQVISNWERGYTEIGREDLIELAAALDCSTDYLIGISEIKHPIADNNSEFESWLNDPRSKILFKEFKESSEEQKEALLKMWEILKSQGKV